MFTRQELDRLLIVESAPAVSIYVPTHVAGRETRQDPIRMRNLLSDAKEKLVATGMRQPDADALLKPGFDLLEEPRFWRHQGPGLAAFVAKDFFRCHRLPVEVPEEVVVGRRFHLKHLVPVLADDGRYVVLALGAETVRLYEGGRHGLRELEHDWPQSVKTVMNETDYQNSLDQPPTMRHAERRGVQKMGVKSHNFGEDPEELRHAILLEFLRRVASGASERFSEETAPVVLVAQPKILGHMREFLRIDSLLPAGLEANPDALDERELHARTYELVKPRFESSRHAALDQFNALFGDGDPRGIVKLEEAIRAARYGQVDKLLIARGAELWGRFDESTERVVAAGESPGPDTEDLLDLAATQTLKHGGHVHFVEKDQLPQGSVVGAVLRFAREQGAAIPSTA